MEDNDNAMEGIYHYELDEKFNMDPMVKRYQGTFLPPKLEEIVKSITYTNDKEYKIEEDQIVYIYQINNADLFEQLSAHSNINIPTTYKAEVGNNRGIYGKSSPFCNSIKKALKEAVYDLAYQMTISSKGVPTQVWYRTRII